MVEEKTRPSANKEDSLTEVKDLILYNDDVNTVDFVIESLVEVCKLASDQAEQCTLIVHYRGYCAVKSGYVSELKPMVNALSERGLTAELK